MNWQHKISDASAQILSERHAPGLVKELAWRALAFAIRCRRSNPVSFVLRPLFAHTRLRTGIGALMVVLAISVAIWNPIPSFAGENTGGPLALNVLPEGEVTLSTKASVVLPLKNFTLSQKYWAFHPGIDMATPMGSSVNPIMAGKVIKVENSRIGYGNNVTVQHANNYESLYAHLSEIEVKEGQEVSNATEIGLSGSTGRSSGPHLHLEVRDDSNRTINPQSLLDIK